ncbi:hypothetical protein PENTCL1PPCAC_5751 [Pristionchus entomophagus]|uniref:Uncharacterized protein n=1 Tax=Pristionchus entomophagus TaxID=358040 RepID=A0AAV5SJQ6_9BILA|nr:hypothetical protein PENTCL1PPCAC_5751 [Pristionchus entomophagus]
MSHLDLLGPSSFSLPITMKHLFTLTLLALLGYVLVEAVFIPLPPSATKRAVPCAEEMEDASSGLSVLLLEPRKQPVMMKASTEDAPLNTRRRVPIPTTTLPLQGVRITAARNVHASQLISEAARESP